MFNIKYIRLKKKEGVYRHQHITALIKTFNFIFSLPMQNPLKI